MHCLQLYCRSDTSALRWKCCPLFKSRGVISALRRTFCLHIQVGSVIPAFRRNTLFLSSVSKLFHFSFFLSLFIRSSCLLLITRFLLRPLFFSSLINTLWCVISSDASCADPWMQPSVPPVRLFTLIAVASTWHPASRAANELNLIWRVLSSKFWFMAGLCKSGKNANQYSREK